MLTRCSVSLNLHSISSTLGLLLLIAGSAGCGRSASSLGSGYSKLFQSADQQTKADWDTAIAAIKTNGYVLGIVSLSRLGQQTNLSAEQGAAIRETVGAVSDQMHAAANKGDPAASNSIVEL